VSNYAIWKVDASSQHSQKVLHAVEATGITMLVLNVAFNYGDGMSWYAIQRMIGRRDGGK
jgi:hypothetical protein